MMTFEEFKRVNVRYDSNHYLGRADYDKAMKRVEMIGNWHKSGRGPQVGDLVEGAYYDGMYPYESGLIERVDDDGTIHICYNPMIPFVFFNDMLELRVSVSGGPFGTHKAEELELVKENDERYFCDWGTAGACANGAINFTAPVRRWRIPYVRQSKTFVTVFNKDHEVDAIRTDYAGSCYIDSEWLGWRHLTFVSFDAFKKYAEFLGVTYKYWDNCDSVKRYRLSHDIKEMPGFWSLDELPEGVKPIYAMCNGSMVLCYFRTMEHDVEFYRPNPNAKEVYQPLSFEMMQRVRKGNGWM